ncbi:unnamed protein product [Effrenium voratum]|uniref:Gamma-butyrobetaine dioxygenase n=1 Tax=Effrenium voratum TaxID=2562239 RepID=A0AA36MUH3_9DINO|nr:unnamed protein product [Effrenium voratum]CAJ1435268.1 unnamed protein product [Effrenium voratum]
MISMLSFLLPRMLLAMPAVDLSQSSLQLSLDGHKFHLDPYWLRERCLSQLSVDLSTLQPLLNPHELPMDMTFENASILGNDTLQVAFTDGHTSKYQLKTLLAELTDFRSNPIQPAQYERPRPSLWSGDLQLTSYNHHDIITNEEVRLNLTEMLLTKGVALVKKIPKEHGIVTAFAKNMSTLRTTDWGPFFNVRVTPDTAGKTAKQDLAYTGKAIGLHTDNPYRDPTPDFQLLHALEHCSCNGKAPCDGCSVLNYIVDGFYIAELLRNESQESYDLLSSIPVRFENNGGDGTSALVTMFPHLELSHDKKEIQAVRFSAKSGQYAPALSPEMAAKFYQARRRFSELAHQPEHALTMQFEPGDILVFDNRRVLHARSHIPANDAARWVQGCYMDRDGLWYAFERLRRIVRGA